MTQPGRSDALELWAGVECTVNRVRDRYFCQLSSSGHAARIDDLDRFAALGIRALRYPVLWERTAPGSIEQADWRWADERLSRLRALRVEPIVGLVHHGSGPSHTSLIDPNFPEMLAEYAAAVARRYPWVEHYTPVNEPLTTARFSALYGWWYPHARDERSFLLALIHQCKATVLAMHAIRQVSSNARLVQTDDLGKTYSRPLLAYQTEFQNELRWLSWDLLCGRVDRQHPLWHWIVEWVGIDERSVLWFSDRPCVPDIIGLNYYVTSERFLDERLALYPSDCHGGNHRHRYADVEAVRVLASPTIGIQPLIEEAWERYRLPIAITEAHLAGMREDQLRWLATIWEGAWAAKRNGADVRAVTAWALLGSHDWDCLVTECRGYYESGAFDTRGQHPRATAVAGLMRELGAGREPSHPVLVRPGWWQRPDRFACEPVALERLPVQPARLERPARPILITGATGTLGQAFARICSQRGLAFRLLKRSEMDIADPASVEEAFKRHEPWAIINAAGYVRVDEAESDCERCYRENTIGPRVISQICARHGTMLLTFSSDLVFDGSRQSPYVETDPISPLNVYGRSKAEAEACVLDRHPGALVVRTSSFFGPWDDYNFITILLRELRQGRPFGAADDLTVSPTYVPDLVHACLDLLIDKESGIWHLTNGAAVTWAQWALQAASLAGVDPSGIEVRHSEQLNFVAKRPLYSAMTSERGLLLPSLDNAMDRYLVCERAPPHEQAPKAA